MNRLIDVGVSIEVDSQDATLIKLLMIEANKLNGVA